MAGKVMIQLTPEELKLAIKLGRRRSGSVGHAETLYSHNPTMGSLIRHIIGAKAEYVYSRYTGYPVDITTIGKGDDGTDFPDGANVKGSEIEKKPNLLIDLISWERIVPKFYVLIWVQNPKFNRLHSEILGFITREDADRVKYKVLKGERGCIRDDWWIERRYLKPIAEKPEGPDLSSFAAIPLPKSKPSSCLECEAMGGWKPYSDISMYCFYSAKILKRATQPVICTEAVLHCPIMND